MCLRDVVPIMNLEKEISSKWNLGSPDPMIKYKLFEDDESCVKKAKAQILTPKTKHISLDYHHFRSYVENFSISIGDIRTGKQNSDVLTKLVGDPQFICLRKKCNGH